VNIPQIDFVPKSFGNLPESLWAVTTNQALDFLGISRSTLDDYKVCLSIEKPIGWDYSPHQRGLTAPQIEVLAILNYLVKRVGRPQAQRLISKAAQDYFKQKEIKDNG